MRNRVPTTARGLASRNKLKVDALAVFNELGYRQARVSDITNRAGVALGLFYRYFDDLTAIAAELFLDILAPFMEIEQMLDPSAPDALLDKFVVHSSLVVTNYIRNPGLMRSWYSIGEDSEEFRRKAARQNEDYLHYLLTDRWPGEEAAQSPDRSLSIFRGYMLQGIAQAPMTAYNSWAHASLAPMDKSPPELVEIATLAAYRMVAARDPGEDALLHARRRISEIVGADGEFRMERPAARIERVATAGGARKARKA